MDKDVYKDMMRAIKDRGTWETRQDQWYRMRYLGIRRAVKPYPNAPDMHYPLADTSIEKLKPFYAQQIYSNERIATFVSQKGAAREITTQAEQYFDYSVKQRSNFESAMFIATDTHLTYGLCVVKIYWDNKLNRLAYDPIDPIYIIVPQHTEETQGADWLVQVLRLSRTQYEANKKYKQGDEFIRSIAGRGFNEGRVAGMKEQDVAQREGLTYAADDSQIILWEAYTRQDGKWMVETIAPALGFEEPVREPFGLPYKHGKLPFVALRADMGQKGWYSPRGVPEILFKHEMSLNKSWNSKLQYLDFFGQPNFKNNSLQPINTGNWENRPGKILPPGIEKEQPASAPIDFEKEMQFVRALAEDRIAIPDLGASEHLTGSGKGKSGDTTATQVNAIIGLSNQSNDLRARVFRSQLGEIYMQSWDLLTERAGDQLQYIYDNSIQNLPPDALMDAYTITPSGSADSWNVAARQAKALALYQMLFGKPNVNQDELLKFTLENGDDPILVKRLFQDTGMQQKNQGEKQAAELSIMLLGYPVEVKPDDMDAVHLQTQVGFTERRLQTGEPLTPDFMQLNFMHANQHVEAMRKKKDPSANMWAKQLNQFQKMYSNSMQQVTAQQQQPAQMTQTNGPIEQQPQQQLAPAL